MKVALFIFSLLVSVHADKLKDDFKKIGQSVKEAGKEVGKKGKELGLAVGHEAKKVGQEVANDTKDVRTDVKKGAQDTGHWFTDFGHKVRDGWNKFWRGGSSEPSKPQEDFK